MEQTIIEVLKAQRNDAMDTIAVLNAHLAALRHENMQLRTKTDGPTKEQSASSSYDSVEINKKD